MSDYVHLTGADDVRRAGTEISAAAESFRNTVGWLAEEMAQTRIALEENNQLLTRLLAERERGSDV